MSKRNCELFRFVNWKCLCYCYFPTSKQNKKNVIWGGGREGGGDCHVLKSYGQNERCLYFPSDTEGARLASSERINGGSLLTGGLVLGEGSPVLVLLQGHGGVGVGGATGFAQGGGVTLASTTAVGKAQDRHERR